RHRLRPRHPPRLRHRPRPRHPPPPGTMVRVGRGGMATATTHRGTASRDGGRRQAAAPTIRDEGYLVRLVDSVSPELALVDPELCLRARPALPAPSDCLAQPAPFVPRSGAPSVERSLPSRRPSLLAAVAALIAASLIGLHAPTPDLRAGAHSVAHALQRASGAAS